MPTTSAPRRELGVVSNQPSYNGPLDLGWSTIVDESEHSPKLQWPDSIEIYDQMLNDSQINALRLAITLPLKRRRWLIDPNGADDKIVRHIAGDLGLPILGEDDQPRVVDPRRFSWKRHLHHVLLAPFYGHYFFTQYAPIGPDGLAHLRKLLPLPPRTIDEIRAANDGGLQWVRQRYGRGRDQFGRPDPIPVSSLVAYVWEQEAGNWAGRSLLRPCYRDWLAKDDLIRSNLVKLRRNGMGIPLGLTTQRDANPTEAPKVQAIAQAARAGEESAATLPYGYDLRFRGTEGTIPDAVPSIKLHDEAMARSFLAMFLQLGQTDSGARALGESFIDFFATALDAVAEDGVCDPTTLHVIRDLVDWNYGDDVELIPLLVSERDEDPELSVSDLSLLVERGVITVDTDLEATIRKRRGLPAKQVDDAPSGKAYQYDLELQVITKNERRAQLGLPPITGGDEFVEPQTVTPSTGPDNGAQASASRNPLRRAFDRLRGRPTAAANDDPMRHVDWTDLDATWRAALEQLIVGWGDVREAQITELTALIEEAGGDLAALAALNVEPRGADMLTDALHRMADYGVLTAQQEAAAQGATLPAPGMDQVRLTLEQRAAAVAELLTRALSEAAGRQALQRTGGALAPTEVATEVAEHLRGLSNAYLEENLGGALTQGLNTGRRTAMGGAPAGTRIVASALLDANACGPCSQEDGHEYESLEQAEGQFPVGGNKDCDGGVRCRCTLVAIYPESAPSVQ